MDANPYALLFDDEPTAQERAEALAAALRGQAQQVQQRDALASIASMGSNPLLQGFARGQLARVGQQEDDLRAQGGQIMGALERRPQLQLQRQNLAELQRRQAALADPTSVTSQLRTSLTRQFGGSIPDNSPGNAVDDKELELLARRQAAEENRALRRSLSGIGAAANTSDETVDAMARAYRKDKNALNALGRGASTGGLRQRIIDRAVQLAKEEANGGPVDLVGEQAAFHTDSASLTEAQKLADAMDRNEAKAKGDIEIVRKAMAKLSDTGSPLFNAPLRALQQKRGDPNVTAFLTAREAAVNQISKVLSATAGSGALSDSARHEAASLIQSDASLAQLNAAFDVLTQDMERNKAAMHQSVADIRGRMGGGGSKGPVRISSEAEYDKLPSGAEFIDPEGAHRRKP